MLTRTSASFATERVAAATMATISEILHNIATVVCSANGPGNWVFRGVSNERYELVPSIGRHAGVGRDYGKACELEELYFRQFRRTALLHLNATEMLALREARDEVDGKEGRGAQQTTREPTLGEQWVWTGLMQHFGVPTRFLDWTESVWFALYFACVNDSDQHGVVYLLNRASLHRQLDDRSLDPVRLFPKKTNPSKDVIQVVEMPHAFWRVANQLGLFTATDNPCEDHKRLLKTRLFGTKSFLRWRIPSHVKRPLLKLLKNMNIAPHTVYPGLDGIAQSLREEVGTYSRP